MFHDSRRTLRGLRIAPICAAERGRLNMWAWVTRVRTKTRSATHSEASQVHYCAGEQGGTTTRERAMQAEPLIQWPEPVYQLLEFVAAFLVIGPLGFRYAVARPGEASNGGQAVCAVAVRRAAAIGLVGAGLALVHIAIVLPDLAARRHLAVGAAIRGDPLVAAWILLTGLAALGYLVAWRGHAAGWPLAAAGVIGSTLRNLANGQWAQLVNPLHLLAGGLWIGTLFVMVVAGL